LKKIVYEEKPQCGRCGAGIVGVIPKRRDGKPLCRECAFELEDMAYRTMRGKIGRVEEKVPPSPEELTRRKVVITLLGVIILMLLFRIYTIAPMLQPPKPIRLGVKNTDSLTDKCIEQLWVLSRNLQDGNLPRILPVCPSSSKQYIVTRLKGDTVISCPTPEEHGLAKLSVSLNLPIPNALAGDAQ
jgi:hypothetical protein